jgi:hypothetical protein
VEKAHSTGTEIVLIISGGMIISGKIYSTGTRTGLAAAEAGDVAPAVPVTAAVTGTGETPANRPGNGRGRRKGRGVTSSTPLVTAGTIRVDAAGAALAV